MLPLTRQFRKLPGSPHVICASAMTFYYIYVQSSSSRNALDFEFGKWAFTLTRSSFVFLVLLEDCLHNITGPPGRSESLVLSYLIASAQRG